MSEIRIGTSGWSYDHWDGVCYPHGTPPAKRRDHYVARFDTVELNASFYRWPRDTTFAGWRRRLPHGFALSVKAPRGLTHGKKLYAPEVWIERIARCWHELGDRRAVLLVQLPPAMERDDAHLETSSPVCRGGSGWPSSSGTRAGITTPSTRCSSGTGPRTA